jgi:hypothetical protein
MTREFEKRLERLESAIKPIRGCDACIDLVGTIRIVKVDEKGNELQATRPTHCPTCGTDLAPDPPMVAEVRLLRVDVDRI